MGHLRQVQADDFLFVAEVEPAAGDCGYRPTAAAESGIASLFDEACGRGLGQAEIAAFTQDDEVAVGDDQSALAVAPGLPLFGAGQSVDCT